MAIKIDVRKVLQLDQKGITANMIEKQYHISKRSRRKVLDRKIELEFDMSTLNDYTDQDLYELFFPDSILNVCVK
ncbi:MAG: hypothetical protein LUF02_00080 [Erysipelotrichaceae bacterium]|nr:hypothetical protein [Erysipelotrichaceae bacterium]